MKEILKNIKSGIIIFITILVCTTVYAAVWNPTEPMKANSGGKLESGAWNKVLENLNWLNGNAVPAPSGAVIAFNLTSCPTGWLPANGDNGTPDLRGKFIRGLNSFENGANKLIGEESDEDGSTRTLASYQGDAIRNLTGELYSPSNSAGSFNGFDGAFERGRKSNAAVHHSYSNGYAAKFNASRVVPTGSDNRPKNIALIYCVKE